MSFQKDFNFTDYDYSYEKLLDLKPVAIESKSEKSLVFVMQRQENVPASGKKLPRKISQLKQRTEDTIEAGLKILEHDSPKFFSSLVKACALKRDPKKGIEILIKDRRVFEQQLADIAFTIGGILPSQVTPEMKEIISLKLIERIWPHLCKSYEKVSSPASKKVSSLASIRQEIEEVQKAFEALSAHNLDPDATATGWLGKLSGGFIKQMEKWTPQVVSWTEATARWAEKALKLAPRPSTPIDIPAWQEHMAALKQLQQRVVELPREFGHLPPAEAETSLTKEFIAIDELKRNLSAYIRMVDGQLVHSSELTKGEAAIKALPTENTDKFFAAIPTCMNHLDSLGQLLKTQGPYRESERLRYQMKVKTQLLTYQFLNKLQEGFKNVNEGLERKIQKIGWLDKSSITYTALVNQVDKQLKDGLALCEKYQNGDIPSELKTFFKNQQKQLQAFNEQANTRKLAKTKSKNEIEDEKAGKKKPEPPLAAKLMAYAPLALLGYITYQSFQLIPEQRTFIGTQLSNLGEDLSQIGSTLATDLSHLFTSASELHKSKLNEEILYLQKEMGERSQIWEQSLEAFDTIDPNKLLGQNLAKLKLEKQPVDELLERIPIPMLGLEESETWVSEMRDIKRRVEQVEASIQEPLSVKQTAQFLDTPPMTGGIERDKNILVHTLLDVAGKESGYEGGNPGVMLERMHEMFGRQIEMLNQHPLCDDATKVDLCQTLFASAPFAAQLSNSSGIKLYEDISKKLEKAKEVNTSMHGTSGQFHAKIIQEIENLKAGQTFFFQGGWPKHAVVYEFEKQSDGKITFRVFNLGEGANFQARATIDTQILFVPFIEVVDINLKHLNEAITSSLKDLQVLDDDRYSGDKHLEKIILEMKGRISRKSYKEEHLMGAQQSGTCSYMSLLAAFHTHALRSSEGSAVRNIKRFDFRNRLKTFVDFDRTHSNEYISDPEALTMMQTAADILLSDIRTWKTKSFISVAEANFGTERIEGIQKHLHKAQEQLALAQRKAQPKFVVAADPYMNQGQAKIANSNFANIRDDDISIKSGFSPIKVKSWDPDGAQSFSDYVKEHLKAFNELSNKSRTSAQQSILDFVQQIPLRDASFWKKVDSSKAGEIVTNLKHIFRQYMFNIGKLDRANRKNQLQAHEHLAFIKFMTLADKLGRSSNLLGANFPSFYQKRFGYCLENGSLYCLITDEKWAAELLDIKEYWKDQISNKPQHDLFNFDELPAGSMSYQWSVKTRESEHWLQPKKEIPPELNWVIDFISQPAIQDQLNRGFPLLQGRGRIGQALEALYNREVDLLPYVFFDFAEISFLADYALTGSFNNIVSLLETANDFRTVFVSNYYNDKTQTQTVARSLASNSDQGEGVVSIADPLGNFDKKITFIRPEFHLEQASQKIRDPVLSELMLLPSDLPHPLKDVRSRHLITPEINRLTNPSLLNVTQEVTSRYLSLERMRAQLEKNVDGIYKELGEFFESPFYFKQVGRRDQFKHIVLQGTLLFDEMQTPSQTLQTANKFAELFKISLEKFNTEEDFQVTVYLIEMNRLVAARVRELQKISPERFPEGFQNPFFDSLAELRKLQKIPNLPRMVQHAIHREVVGCYKTKDLMTSEEMGEFISSFLRLSQFFPDEILPDRFSDIAARDALRSRDVDIHKALESKGNEILNRVAKEHFPGLAKEAEWDLNAFPRLMTKDRQMVIDLEVGTIYHKLYKQSFLPPFVVSHEAFKQYFGENYRIPVKEIGVAAYEFVFEDISYRIHASRIHASIPPKIQRKIGNDWFQLEDFSNLQLTSTIIKNGNFWNSDNAQQAFITDTSHVPQYRIERVEKDGKKFSYTHQVDAQGKDTGLVVAEPKGVFNHLGNFENLSHVVLLQERETGIPRKLELPRYGLSFDAVKDPKTNKWYFVSSKLDGYRIAETTLDLFVLKPIPGLGKLNNFLLLEKEVDGKWQRRLIMSSDKLKAFEKSKAASFNPSVERVFDDKQKGYELVFDINEKTGKLEPRSDLARLVLAKNLLWKHESGDYALAREYLHGFGSTIQPLTKEEENVLNDMALMKAGNFDPDPRANALRLKATALLMKNRQGLLGIQSTEPLNENILKELKEEFLRYLQNLAYLGETFKLSIEEEVILLNQIRGSKIIRELSPEMKNVINNRLGALKDHSYGLADPLYLLPGGVYGIQTPSIGALEKSESGWISNLARVHNDASTPSESILKTDLTSHFSAFYKVARESHTTVEKEALIRTISLISSLKDLDSNHSKEQLWDILRSILNIKVRSEDENESASALILIKIMENPRNYPTADQLDQAIRDYHANSYSFQNFKDARKLLCQIFNPGVQIISANTLNFFKDGLQPRFLTTQKGSPILSEAQNLAEIEGICQRVVERPFDYQIFQTDLGGILKEMPTDKQKQQEARQAMAHLEVLLSTPLLQKDNERSLNLLKDQFKQYEKELRAVPPKYQLEDMGKLHSLKVDYQGALQLGSVEQQRKARAITKSINKAFKDPHKQALRRAALAAGTEKPIDIDEAIRLYMLSGSSRDTAFYRRRNPALTDRDLIEGKDKTSLPDMIRSYLATATQNQYLTRLISTIDKLERQKSSLAPIEDVEQTIQELAALSKVQRAYKPQEHPEYLVFEYFMEIMLRPDQVVGLDQLKIKDGAIGHPEKLGVVLEMIMGAGKTSVFAPLVGLFNANGQDMAVGILPDPLMNSMVIEQQKTAGKSFNQVVEVLEINPKTPLDTTQLKVLYERLKRIIEERRVLFQKSGSVHHLYLKYVQKLEAYNQQIKNERGLLQSVVSYFYDPLKEEIQIMNDIFGLFRSSGVALFDEIDTILDVLKSSHYTQGEPKPIAPVFRQTAVSLFKFLRTDPTINREMDFGFPGSVSKTPFTKESYHSRVKPLLVQGVLTGKVMGENKELQAFLQKLSADETKSVEAYLLNAPPHEGKKNLAEEGWRLVQKASPQIQDVLALFQEQFNELIPLVAGKNLNEHYGRDPEHPESLISIPYRNSKPSSGSEHGTELETIDFSYFSHRQMTEEIASKVVSAIETDYQSERKRIDNYIECPSYQRMLKYTGGKHFNLEQMTDALRIRMTQTLIEYTNAHPDLQVEIIDEYVISQVKVYEKQLNADAQLYSLLYKKYETMTGTPWNLETFAGFMRHWHPSNTAIKTLKILIEKSPQKVHTIAIPKAASSRDAIRNLLHQLYHRKDMPNGSLIDTAGMFRDFTDRAEVAHELLLLDCWKDTAIKGVAFYDAKDKLMVMTLLNGKPHVSELAKSPLTKEEIVAFWDQPHTTGSDIKLGARMSAVVPIGRHTIFRDVAQSVWRERGLDKEQTVNFVVAGEDSEIIKKSLKEKVGLTIEGELTRDNLILYTILNQADRQASDNYRSLTHKRQALLLEKVLSVLFDPSINMSDKMRIYQGCHELFVEKFDLSPSQIYGRPKSASGREKVLEDDEAAFLKSNAMKTFETDPLLKVRFPFDEILDQVHKLTRSEMSLMPEKLVQSGAYGKERSRSTTVEHTTQKSTAKEVSQERATYSSDPGSARSVVKWDKSQMFSRGYFEPNDLSYVKSMPAELLNLSGKQLLLRTQDIFSGYSNLAPLAKAFDSKLACSLNLCPLFDPGITSKFKMAFQSILPANWLPHPYTLFGIHQGNADYALAVEDKATGEMQLILMDISDGRNWKQLLIDDAKHPDPRVKREVRVGLYHFASGILVEGHEGFGKAGMSGAERFEKDEALVPLKVQGDFFRGHSHFNENEITHLEKWLKANDAKALYHLYTEVILAPWREDSLNKYKSSSLKALFKRLGLIPEVPPGA